MTTTAQNNVLPTGSLLSLTDLETLAIAKAVKDAAYKDARGNIRPGKYAVDVSVKVTGSVNVGDDYTSTPTASIPIIRSLALVLKYAGVTRDAALNMLEKAMREAVAGETSANDLLAEADIAAVEERVRATLAKLPEIPCKGKVTTKLTVEKLP